MESEQETQETAAGRDSSVRLPLTLTIVAVLVWTVFQTFLLLAERSNLSATKQQQDLAVQESQKLRAQFKAIASKTVELAKKGNANANAVVEQFGKTGIDLGSVGGQVP
ncbi:MAG TPA: hypothetical protein VNN77_04955 [candidate division Zixibacteria bacterium]|nr:hypothetical protein [candidate division Zixibacteria bacterium]